MRINIGAGKQTWQGFYCIDAVQHPKATRPLDMKFAFEFHKDGTLKRHIPIADGIAEEVHNYHFIEHVYRWEADAVIREFKRLLVSGGYLVMECPDIEKACRNLIKGGNDQMSMWPLYGDWSHKDPYMMHRHGYTPKTITQLLKDNGFVGIQILPPMTHGRRAMRDMRIEARKP